MRFFTGVLLFSLLSIELSAQCEGGRYRDKIFPLVDIESDIVYGQNQTYADVTEELLVDVYQPIGDTTTLRPLVIFAHGGYFLGGDKADESVAPICTDLAKMGYVTASISYRLGIPLQLPLDAPFMEAIMRAVHDMRASVRYFRKTVAEDGNPYRINPDEIYVGGVSAGGFITLHLAYMDEDELPSTINTANPGLGGGLEGLSGHAEYSSQVKGIISIAGAIGDTTWIEQGDLPAFLSHGSEDTVVPFGSEMLTLIGLFDVSEVDGSSSIHAKMEELDIDNCFEIYWGQDHVPQQNLELYFDTTLSIVSNFLSHMVCPSVPLDCDYRTITASLSEEKLEEEVLLYPNPSSGIVYLAESNARIIGVYDSFGKRIGVRTSRNQLHTDELSAGVYIVEIEKNERRFTKKLVVN